MSCNGILLSADFDIKLSNNDYVQYFMNKYDIV